MRLLGDPTLKVRGVALIGVGMVSGTYVEALAGLQGLRLTGALGARAGSDAAFLAKHGLDGVAYGSVDEIAGDDAVDFVILTTPPNARVEICEILAAASKPVLMEKPVERSLAAASGLVDLFEAAGLPFGIMLQHRARSVARELRARVDAFGALRAVEIAVPWWRDQSYYDVPGRGSYTRDGGGVLMSQAIHTLDLALQFTGPVAEVSAMCATTGFHHMEAEDFVSAGLRFANGAVGSLFSTTAAYPGRGEQIALHYAKASVRLEAGVLCIDWQDGRHEEIGAQASSGAGADPMAFSCEWHQAMIADFVCCLETGDAPIATGRSALSVHALIEAIERSGKSGRHEAVLHG